MFRGRYEELIFAHHVFAARFHEGAEDWKLFVCFLPVLCEKFRRTCNWVRHRSTTVLALPRMQFVRYASLLIHHEAVIEAFNLISIGQLSISSEEDLLRI